MAISYNRMWKLLVDKKMSKADLRKAADIAPNTMTKLRRDEPVNLAILGRICDVLNCDYGDLMQYVPEENTNDQCHRRIIITKNSALFSKNAVLTNSLNLLTRFRVVFNTFSCFCDIF